MEKQLSNIVTRLLTETTAGDTHNAGFLQRLHAPELIGRLPKLLRLCDGLLRHGEGGEGIHCTGDGLAADAAPLLVQCLLDDFRLALQAIKDITPFLMPEVEGGITLLGRIGLARHNHLSGNIRTFQKMIITCKTTNIIAKNECTKVDGHQLVHLR